jgi:hypothetical protein
MQAAAGPQHTWQLSWRSSGLLQTQALQTSLSAAARQQQHSAGVLLASPGSGSASGMQRRVVVLVGASLVQQRPTMGVHAAAAASLQALPVEGLRSVRHWALQSTSQSQQLQLQQVQAPAAGPQQRLHATARQQQQQAQ